MPLKKGTSRENCISINYKELRASGRPHKVAQAASLNHCNKIYGGIPKKKKHEDDKLFVKLKKEHLVVEMKDLIQEYEKKKKKWMQKASKKMARKGTEGDFTTWCKRHGFSGVCQACINAAAKAGGHASQMANFAVNTNKGKYRYPKKKGKK